MKTREQIGRGVCGVLLLLTAVTAQAQFNVGDPAPDIEAVDINGNRVSLQAVLETKPDLALVFFFTASRAEVIALRLQVLNDLTEGLEVIALGMEDEKEALQKFAKDLGLKYYIIPGDQVRGKPWAKDLQVLPVTLFVVTQESTIDRVIRGGSATQAKLLSYAAENFFRQRKLAQAKAVTSEAIKVGENEAEARELNGFILTAEGKLDEAEAEFGQIDSKTGLAKVALERGDADKAIALAEQANEPYATAIKGQAQMRAGKLEEAANTLSTVLTKEAAPWQRSEAYNAHGRIQHQLGDASGAIKEYETAVALDPYNVVALSNNGAALRETGDLEGAQATLERAGRIRQDELATMMLQQIQRELKRQNDIERTKLINKQIKEIGARLKELKASGELDKRDTWSTRPLVLAFLPAEFAPVFFERAGTDTVLQRELESRLQESGEVGVVEREMLDKLLQELNLGSSELASPDTQRSLGKVLSAGMLGFIEFAQLGNEKMLYLRLIDTETTEIAAILRQPIDEDQPAASVEALVEQIIEKAENGGEMKGLIADASSEDNIIINLGTRHGAAVGQEFIVLKDADPIKIGDKVIAHRTLPVGTIIVTTIEPDYAICKIGQRKDGVSFDKEMKIKARQ